jgi:predicted MFS family arabinose efflux permease
VTKLTAPGRGDARPAPSPTPGGVAMWAPVVALCFGIAILVTSEFLPASVLPTMAADLGLRKGVAGLAVAATAIAGACTAPSIAVLVPHADRRKVLIVLLASAAVANVGAALSPGLAVLLMARVILGVGIAGYWAFSFGAATQAVPGRNHVVSAALAFGVSVATVVGVPLASFVCDQIGWRAAFMGAAALTAGAALSVAACLPSVPAHPAAGFTMLRQAILNPRLVAGVSCVVLVVFGNFAAYPYIRTAIARVDASSTTWLLLAWGIGGMAGNVLAGKLAARLRTVAGIAPMLLAASLVGATSTRLPLMATAIALWGLAFNIVPVATQLWVTRVEPERAESAVSLQVTAFQLAIMGGSAAGGAILDAFGMTTVLVVGAATAGAGGLGFALLSLPRD